MVVKPQIRFNERSIFNRSIKPRVLLILRMILAMKALVNQPRSCEGHSQLKREFCKRLFSNTITYMMVFKSIKYVIWILNVPVKILGACVSFGDNTNQQLLK